MIEWIEKWTQTQTDGDWEHEHGIRLELLDNSGWLLSADLINYQEYLADDVNISLRENDCDWIDIDIKDCYINITGDITKLNKILITFRAIIEKMETENRKIDENTLWII